VKTSKGWKELAASSEAAAASAWADDLRRGKCPVLAISGEDDTSVPPAENRDKMVSYLTAAGVPHSTTVVPGLSHSVTTYHDLKGGQWSWPDRFWVWSRRPAALDMAIAEWVKRHGR
jgi:fermentation-respiration switch protein FrsA (DUF1100 family)